MFKVVLILILIFPSISLAQIIFSEIMYDPSGTDTGYEWLEIKNTSNYSVNLKNYQFCEGSPTCHSWAVGENENFIIESGEFAIITDDRAKFLEQNEFSGLILVSTNFILNNTGELIQIKNSKKNLEDSLKYNSKSGGKSGNTLSIFDNIWKNGQATPGRENIEIILKATLSSKSNNLSNNKINTSYVEISDTFLGKKKLRAEIEEVGVLMAGSKTKFIGKAYGISGVEISGVYFFWNMGDGTKKRGQFIFHEYDFPAEYIVSLTVQSGDFSGTTKTKIKVINPAIEISDVKMTRDKNIGFIKIKNNFTEILNIENWIISVDGERFLIPKKTYIDKKSEIIFSNRATNLQPQNTLKKKSRIYLLFPNGEILFSYSFDKNEISFKTFYENTEEIEVLEKPKIIFQEKIKKEEVKKKDVLVNLISNLENSEVNFKNENFNSEKYFIEKSTIPKSENFIKNSWPFLFFLFILGSLIISILYIKNKEKEEEELLQSDLDEESLKSEAEEYKIKEIIKK